MKRKSGLILAALTSTLLAFSAGAVKAEMIDVIESEDGLTTLRAMKDSGEVKKGYVTGIFGYATRLVRGGPADQIYNFRATIAVQSCRDKSGPLVSSSLTGNSKSTFAWVEGDDSLADIMAQILCGIEARTRGQQL